MIDSLCLTAVVLSSERIKVALKTAADWEWSWTWSLSFRSNSIVTSLQKVTTFLWSSICANCENDSCYIKYREHQKE